MKPPSLFRSSLKFLALAWGTLVLAGPASAAVLVTYSFTNGPAATVTGGNLSAGDAAWAGFSAQAGFSNTTGTAYVRSDQTGNAFSSSQYLGVTITANAGYVLDLSSFSFLLGGTNLSASNYTVDSNLRTSAEATAFSTNVSLTPGPVTTASYLIPASTSDPIFTTFAADLSGASYQNLQQITLRLYTYDSLNSATAYLRFDSLTLSGSVAAVPEPSSRALMVAGFALLVGVGLRRRCCA